MVKDNSSTEIIDLGPSRRDEIERFIRQLLEFEELSRGMFSAEDLEHIKELRVTAQGVLTLIDSFAEDHTEERH